jgi:hypothetical protein
MMRTAQYLGYTGHMANRMNLQIISLFVLALVFSGTLYSAEPMSADAVKSLLTNNTMNCMNLNKNKEFTNYYREDGTVTKLMADGLTMDGSWRVTEDGRHCQDWGMDDGECCFPIVDKGNGTYQKIEKGKPRTEFTVTEGNPNNL